MAQLKFPRINTITLSARLTRDPELKYLPNGTANTKMSIAFDRSYKKGDEWIQETSYLDLIAWTKLAEKCGAELHKGSPIIAEGYIQMREYTNKEERKVRVYELVAHKISLLEKGEIVKHSEPVEEDEEY